jgi:hypothetical protein
MTTLSKGSGVLMRLADFRTDRQYHQAVAGGRSIADWRFPIAN